MFDLTRKYRIESNEGDCHYASSFADAKYQAGVIRLNIQAALRDPEWIIVTRQLGKPARWYATERLDGGEKLTPAFCDAVDVPAAHYQDNKARALAKLIEREELRRKRQRDEQQRRHDDEAEARRNRFGALRIARKVICRSTTPPRGFVSICDAAEWVGVRPQSMDEALKKRRHCSNLDFAFADECDPATVAQTVWGEHDDVSGGQIAPVDR